MAAVKVIITTLDNLPLLKEQISILHTDALIDEIIVVNNGSKDGTSEWLLQLRQSQSQSQSHQQKITVINRENRGAGPGRNAGIEAAGGCEAPFLGFLDGGIRPLRGGTEKMLHYLKRRPKVDVIGVEIPDFETDYTKAWRRWPKEITDDDTYVNTRLSHTAYCLARGRAFDGLRFREVGPFGEPGWGADDDEMAYQWRSAGVVVHVVTGVHPYRRGSGSFQRLFQETGIWPNQYGSVYEKRLVWLQQNWPQYQPGAQWGEPWLTLIIEAGSKSLPQIAHLIKLAHDKLRTRRFESPWEHVWHPYSIVLRLSEEPIEPTLNRWIETVRLRQHHGDVILVDNRIVRRNKRLEPSWTGDFRVCHVACIRPTAYYYARIATKEDLLQNLARYDIVHPRESMGPPTSMHEEIRG